LAAAAAFDVFIIEPAKESALFGAPNFVATPHLGASTNEAQENVALQWSGVARGAGTLCLCLHRIRRRQSGHSQAYGADPGSSSARSIHD
jgi:hypothetical protein